jgi:hypothetical protein
VWVPTAGDTQCSSETLWFHMSVSLPSRLRTPPPRPRDLPEEARLPGATSSCVGVASSGTAPAHGNGMQEEAARRHDDDGVRDLRRCVVRRARSSGLRAAADSLQLHPPSLTREIWKFDTQFNSLVRFDTQFDISSKIDTLSTNSFKKRDSPYILSYPLLQPLFTHVHGPNCP